MNSVSSVSPDQPDALFVAVVEQTAHLIDLPLLPSHRIGVIENFARIAQVAALVLEFPLPDSIEPDFTFEP